MSQLKLKALLVAVIATLAVPAYAEELPKSGTERPWSVRQNYILDRIDARFDAMVSLGALPMHDGCCPQQFVR